MRTLRLRRVLLVSLAATAILARIWPAPPLAHAAELPTAIADGEFWRLVTELSEPGGAFQAELMSNEDSAQVVIPSLKATTRPGGVYIGVGPEQNFTYIAAIQPRLAFVVDIRRDNMLQHLIYKALFELSADRADFISRLFARPRPSGLGADAGVTALFDAYRSPQSDAALLDANLRAVIDRLTREHRFSLTSADAAAMNRMMQTFRTAGPYNLTGSGDKNLTYAKAMTATDLTGKYQSYLASEEAFRTVRDLERRNLIVPLVGDFAGDTTIRSIGQYLAQRDATVDVFYVSNVERYLFGQGEHGRRFYTNVAALPLQPSSTFIRSVTRDISLRLGIAIPAVAVNWWSVLSPIRVDLDAVAAGRIDTYRQLFDTMR